MSPNQAALYGIVCFFRDKQNQPQKLLLGVSQVFCYFGSIIAAEVLNVIKAFGIKKKSAILRWIMLKITL
jgi:hypothetical protein